MMIKKRCHTFLTVLMLLLTTTSIASASTLLVWPIHQVIASDKTSSALWLENKGKNTVGLQIRIMAWRQIAYQDRYADQSDVIATPPFIKLEPGKRTMIRLMRASTASSATELAYRIVIDEIAAPYLSQANNPQSGIQFQMRYLLPLFIRSASNTPQQRQPEPPQLRWWIAAVNNKPYLYIRNEGQEHARLSKVYWSDSTKKIPISDGFLGYVLPTQEMRWPLPAQAAAPGANVILFSHLSDNADPVIIKRG